MTSRPRVMFYIQHLLGIGHLVRGARVAKALAAFGFDVTAVVGGELPEGFEFGAATVVRLPPVKAGPHGFASLVGPDGQAFGDGEKAARRDLLLRRFAECAPDILLIEAFPFGRRPMRFELLPLLEAARSGPRPPLIAVSVRDILQENRKPRRDQETVDHIHRYFDLVLVHGDPAIARLEDSFPLADAIRSKLVYTGLVGPDPDLAEARERFDVIVSVGGGAVGSALLRDAIAARPICRLRHASWLLLTGPNMPDEDRPAVPSGVTLRAFEPNLAALLRHARLSISQAGYNTVADLLAAPGCRAVLVPYTAGGETEQARRAAVLAERGLAFVLDPAQHDPRAMASVIDQCLDGQQTAPTSALDGALRTAQALADVLRRRSRHVGRPGPGL